MNSNERRLKILYLMQSGKKVTSRSLTEEFGVSKRTIYRDLNVIQKLGVPVTHYPDSGYGVMRDGMIPPIMFSFRELAVVMMGLSFVKSQIDREMVSDAENVSLKIQNAVPASLRSQMGILEKKTLVSPYIHNISKRDQGGDWFVLCSAFTETKPVSFEYRDRHGNVSNRTIDPHILIHFTDHWNVIGFCHEKKALRNFVLGRMNGLVLNNDKRFIHSEEYSVDDLLYGRSQKKIRVVVEVNNKHTFSFLTELPGKVISKSVSGEITRISFDIDNLDYINEWLLRFGSNVKILEPATLVDKRVSLLKNLLRDL